MRDKKCFYFLIVLIVLGAIFGIYDLDISKALFNKNSSCAKFLEIYGEHPAYLIALISSCIIFRVQDTEKSIRSILTSIVTMVLSVLSALYLWIITMDRALHVKISGKVILLGLVVALCLILIIEIILYDIPKEQLLPYKKAAIIAVICVFGELILVHIIKTFWGRVRFRDMKDGYSKFTKWYLPQGITGNQSFPSGHSANAWTLLLFTLFIDKKNKVLYTLTWMFAIIYAVIVGYSRIVIGAHFASDVLFGAAITIGLLMWIKPWIKN